MENKNMDNSSPAINELAMALSKFQGSVEPIQKSKTAKVGSYSYNYADLADINLKIKKPLSENGLGIVQRFIRSDKGAMLQTILTHSSGQWISSELPLQVFEKVQQLGSEITYLRRYTLSSLLGIVTDDDDDGKMANEAKGKKTEDNGSLTAYQSKELENLLGDDAELRKRVLAYYRSNTNCEIEKIQDLPKKSFDWIKGTLEKQKTAQSKDSKR
jgi:hypothetical protein